MRKFTHARTRARTCVLSNAASGSGNSSGNIASDLHEISNFRVSFCSPSLRKLSTHVLGMCVCAHVCVWLKLFSALALLMHDFKANTNFQFASASTWLPNALSFWLLATIVEYTISLIERPTLPPLPQHLAPPPFVRPASLTYAFPVSASCRISFSALSDVIIRRN